jgi:hypothetical protein
MSFIEIIRPLPPFSVNWDDEAFDWLFHAIHSVDSSEFRSCAPTRILKIAIICSSLLHLVCRSSGCEVTRNYVPQTMNQLRDL